MTPVVPQRGARWHVRRGAPRGRVNLTWATVPRQAGRLAGPGKASGGGSGGGSGKGRYRRIETSEAAFRMRGAQEGFNFLDAATRHVDHQQEPAGLDVLLERA